MRHLYSFPHFALGLCSIMAEGQEDAAGATGTGEVSSEGGVTRVQTDGNPEADKDRMVEDATGKAPTDEAKTATDTKEDKTSGEAPEADKDKEPKDEKKGFDKFDFKGTIFEGMSEEMQGKIAPFAAAFSENGTLTDAEVAEAAKSTGFSEAAVRQFMAGAQAGAPSEAEISKPFHDAAGGEAEFEEFREWTRGEGNLTASEEKAINKALGDGEYETARLLMEKPMERWRQAGGGKPARDITAEGAHAGGSGSEGAVTPYKSMAEMQREMADPRYSNDPAFRDLVYKRAEASNF